VASGVTVELSIGEMTGTVNVYQLIEHHVSLLSGFVGGDVAMIAT